ncbi:MAG: GAF domain-containing protein [Candidatus Hodarchaeales archaeon]
MVIINDIEQEKEPSIAPQVASEMKMLLTKNQKILRMITVGSDRKNIFDETDKNYLAEIADTVV